jgi:farnesyl-diphosphate farnesyltransferase
MLSAVGLAPVALLDSGNEPRFRPVYDRWLDRAQADLMAGWEYTLALPWSGVRVRLACAWPLLIGVKTLERLRWGRVLDATQRIKVTRKEIRSLMLRSVYLYPWPSAWRRLIDEHSKGN